MPSSEESQDGRTSRSLSLTTGGLTLLGVMLSIGVTVGIGVSGSWWVRLLAGVATTFILISAVKVGTQSGKGPVARLAKWVIGHPERED